MLVLIVALLASRHCTWYLKVKLSAVAGILVQQENVYVAPALAFTACLIVAPADRADVEDKIPPIVDALRSAAAEAGCMFWNTYEVMGGRGSMRRWRDDERAAADGIHLKPKGYVELGALLLADLMAGYLPTPP